MLKTLALATAVALTRSLAFAQAGGNDAGAKIPENSGTAANGGGRAIRTVQNGRTLSRAPGTMTGMSRNLAVPICGLAANRLPGIPSKLTFSSHGGA